MRGLLTNINACPWRYLAKQNGARRPNIVINPTRFRPGFDLDASNGGGPLFFPLFEEKDRKCEFLFFLV